MMIYIYLGAFFAVILGIFLAWKNKPIRMNLKMFYDSWQTLQKLLAKKETWPQAIIDADKLLDIALKQRHFKGKTMGERLVSAQRQIIDNDAVWFAHKLSNKLETNPKMKLTKGDTKEALVGFRKALVNLGALSNGKTK